MKSAVLLALVAFIAVNADEEFFKCKEGVPYIENECNGCFCTPTGNLGCTMKACFEPRNTELQHCVIGTTSEKDCNKCWCVQGLGSICTNNQC